MEKQHSASHVKEALNNLLIDVKGGSDAYIRNALTSIMNICSNIDSAKDVIREIGGLSFLIDFACSTADWNNLEYGLKALCCAVDQNNFNQREVTKKDIFILMRNTLARENITPSLLKSTVLLTSTILYQNPLAQNMFGDLNCIQCYIDLYQELFPPSMFGHLSVKNTNTSAKLASAEIWQAVNTVLCFSMNNPVHVQNQERCAKLFPVALKILQLSSYYEVICSVSLLLTSLILDNEKNLSILIKHDGLCIFKNRLEIGVASAVASDTVSPEDIQATVHIISLINLCINGSEEYADLLGKMGVVSLISRFLYSNLMDDTSKIKTLLTLGHFIEVSPNTIKDLLDEGNLKSFFKKNLHSNNDNLLKACQYVIHLILMHGNGIKNSSILNFPSDSMKSWNWGSTVDSASCVTEVHGKIRRNQKSSSSSTSSQLSLSELSRIELSKTKEERIKQYLEGLCSYTSEKTRSMQHSKHESKINETYVGVTSATVQKKKTKYFYKKFGSHQALSKLSGMTSSDIDSNKAEIRSVLNVSAFCSVSKCHGSNKSVQCSGLQNLNIREDTALKSNEHVYKTCLKSNQCCACRQSGNIELNNNLRIEQNSLCTSELLNLQSLNGDMNSFPKCSKSCSLCFVKPIGVLSRHRNTAMKVSNSDVKQDCASSSSQMLNISFDSHAASRNRTSTFAKNPLSVFKTPTTPCKKKNPCTSSRSFTRKRPLSVSTEENHKGGKKISHFSAFNSKSVYSTEGTLNVTTVSSDEPYEKRLALDPCICTSHQDTPSEKKDSFLKGTPSSSSSADIQPFYDVLIFPSTKCPAHGLISSVEKVWFKPIDEKHSNANKKINLLK